MAIAVVNSTSAGGSGASVAISVPSGTQDGHLMVLYVAGEGTVTAPIVFQSVAQSGTFNVYQRVASSEPASYTVNTTINGITAVLVTFSGAVRVASESFGFNTASATSCPSAAFAISYPGSMIVSGYRINSTAAITLPGSLAQQGSNPNDGVGVSLNVGTASISATSSSGPTYTATTGSSSTWSCLTFAIQPGNRVASNQTNNGRILSQVRPQKTGRWQAYLAPTGVSVLVNGIVMNCLQGSDQVSVSVALGGTSDTSYQYLYSSFPMQVGTTFVLTTGITLQATDLIRVNSANLNTVFTILGQEITSGDSGKILAQSFPSAGVLTAIYAVPVSGINWASCSTLLVCNQSSTEDYFRVAIQVNNSGDDISKYLYYDTPIGGNDTFEATIGMPLSLNDRVAVRSLHGTCSFNLFGSEVTAA